MSDRNLTPSDLERFKREAKELRRLESITHTEALEKIARREGFPDLWHMQQAAKPETGRAQTGRSRGRLPEKVTAEAVVSKACSRLLEMTDFWLLSALGDWSFEEGDRNRKFGRYLDSWDDPALPLDPALLASARRGINGNLHAAIEASPGVVGRVLRNPSFGPDILFTLEDGVQYRVQVKYVFDCTLTKYYNEVAADSTKSCDFQVVFFVSLPSYEYPAGFWYGADRLEVYRKVNLVGVPAQFTRVVNLLGRMPLVRKSEPFEKLLPHGTALVSEERIQRRFARVLRPSRGEWKFDAATHLTDARVAVGLWNWMKGAEEP